MNQNRREKILAIVRAREVSTQEELQQLLRENGYPVTQATVSRDIRQLRLVKVLSGSGKSIYAVPRSENAELAARFDSLLAESAVHIEAVFNQVIVKCYAGLANAVCAAMDTMRFPGVAGTLAGDDTILVILRSEAEARSLAELLAQKIDAAP